MNAANPGDTIIIHDNGADYVENVDVGVNNLTIKEADGDNVTVKAANANDHVFEVNASYVTIKGLDVYGATGPTIPRIFQAGIFLVHADHCTIENCRCGWNDTHKNWHGIHLLFSSDNTISGNTCNKNTASGIHLQASSGNAVSGNTLSNNGYGMSLNLSDDNTISGNTCNENNGNGIYLQESSGNTVSDNGCRFNTGPGIGMKDSDDNILSDNLCSNNECGILLEGSSANTISGNTCSNNECGIELSESNDNTVSGNTIHDNEHGIWVCDNSKGTGITGNSIERNVGGPATGVHLTSEASNTVISGNTFIDNEPYQALDDETDKTNTWEGNCWSDYTPPGPYSIPGAAGSEDTSPSVPVVSCDAFGAERSTFDLSESVYCYAENLPHDDPAVDIYVVPNKAWAVGDSIGDDVSDGVNTVSTDGSGNIGVTLIWPAPLTAGEYDIVIDVNQNGTLDAGEAIDGLTTVEGFEAVPEFTTIAIPVAAVLGLVFLMSRRSRQSRRRN